MEESRGLVVLACLGAYLAACAALGAASSRRVRSTADFFMAGSGLGAGASGTATFATALGGFAFVGGPGLVYSAGVSSLWIVVAATLGLAITFFLVAKRLRLFAELCDAVSLPDVVALRYGSEATRFLSAAVILFGVLIALTLQLLAMGRVLEGLVGGALAAPVSLKTCVLASAAVLIFYCAAGGMRASISTDLLQGAVMLAGGVAVFLMALGAVEGGATRMVTLILEDDPEAMAPWGTFGMLGCLSWYFLFALGAAGQPHVIAPAMMVKSVSRLRFALPTALAGFCLSALLWIGAGLALRALVLSGQRPEPGSAESAATAFLMAPTVDPLLAALVFAALLAASMSTADALLNMGSAAVVHDLPRALIGRPLTHPLRWARA
ncbi:MAG: hypothetical protein AAF725_27020, partial [Acidobacteriota bacterium]